MQDNQKVNVSYRLIPISNWQKNNKNRYETKPLSRQNPQTPADRKCQSLQFIKMQPSQKVNPQLQLRKSQDFAYLQSCQLKPHLQIQVSKSLVKLRKPKMHIIQSSIIKLPKKYQRLKVNTKRPIPQCILRPCHNQDDSNLINQPNGYQDIVYRPERKMPNNINLKLKKYNKIRINKHGARKQQSQTDYILDNQQQMPNNKLLLRKYPKLVQSKVVKIQNEQNLMKIIQKQSEQLGPEHIKQSKQQPGFQQNPAQLKMQQINPLKIKNSFLKPEIVDYHKGLLSKLHVQLPSQKSQLQFMLPNQQQLYKFIKNYQPICKQIVIQSLFISPIFQVKLFSKQKTNQIQYNGKVVNNMLYFGEMKKGKYDGFGVLINQNGIQEGFWEGGYLECLYIKYEKCDIK